MRRFLLPFILVLTLFFFVGCDSTPPPLVVEPAAQSIQLDNARLMDLIKAQQAEDAKLVEILADQQKQIDTVVTSLESAYTAATTISDATVAARATNAAQPGGPIPWVATYIDTVAKNIADATLAINAAKAAATEVSHSAKDAVETTATATTQAAETVDTVKKVTDGTDTLIKNNTSLADQLKTERTAGAKEAVAKINTLLFWAFAVCGGFALIGIALLCFPATAAIGMYVAPIFGVLTGAIFAFITFQQIVADVFGIILAIGLGVGLIVGLWFLVDWLRSKKANVENVQLISALKTNVPGVASWFDGPTPLAHSIQSDSTIAVTRKILGKTAPRVVDPTAKVVVPAPAPVKDTSPPKMSVPVTGVGTLPTNPTGPSAPLVPPATGP